MKAISEEAVRKAITAIFAVILALLAIIPCITNGADAEEVTKLLPEFSVYDERDTRF